MLSRLLSISSERPHDCDAARRMLRLMTILIVGWLATTTLTFSVTLPALLARRSPDLAEWRASLRASALAALPGFLLLCEFLWHAALSHIRGVPDLHVYDYTGTLLSIFGIFVGPLCFLASYSCRPAGLPSARVGSLIFAYFFTWAMSCCTSLFFALTV